MRATSLLPLLLLVLPVAAGCQQTASDTDADANENAITSNDGKALELKFDSEVLASSSTSAKEAALSQLEYMVGMLTTDVRGNAQWGHAKLTNVSEVEEGDGKRVKFSAAVPVIWQKNTDVPTEYAVALPLDTRKLTEFNNAYDGKCGKNEYGRETFWHDWNPHASGCELGADVHKATASVRPHPQSTEGKYLEYDRVWDDDRLDVVGVFGILSSFNDSDGGVREFNAMLAEAERGMTGKTKEEVTPGSTVLRATKLTGKKTIDGRQRTVSVTTILVNSVEGAGSDFDELYKPASEKADYIYYGGHSGLGANIRSLADRAQVARGKYQIVYLNGCQTWGYLGTTWNDKKKEANGASDPEGTKDLDIFLTGLPAYDDNARSMLSIYKSLEAAGSPKTINKILEDFSSYHLNVVFGEDDNKFTP